MTWELAESAKHFIATIINGSDLVPTFSTASIDDLRTEVVLKYVKDKSIFFSSFQPDPAPLIRKLQSAYPVFFLTNGGSEIYADIRRNSLEEAMRLCLAGGLNGIR